MTMMGELTGQVFGAPAEADELDICSAPHSTTSRVARALEPMLSVCAEAASERDRAVLRAFFDDLHTSEVDYDRYADAFASEYFLRNYCKTSLALQRDGATYHRRVADLGCGSAAVTLAYLAYLDDTLPPGRWPVDIQLVDRSERQLTLAQQFLAAAQPALAKVEASVRYIRSDIRQWASPNWDAVDCVFAGHVLTENRQDVDQILWCATGAADRNANVYVFERPNDAVWSAIDCEVRDLGLPANSGITAGDAIPRKLETKYLKLSMPNRKELVALIRRYFMAWRMQSVDLLDEVFAECATYHEKPFEAPYKGIEEIRRYWREKVLPQRNLKVDVIDVAYAHNKVWAHWRASFVDAKARLKSVVGVLSLETGEDPSKATALHELFRSTTA